MTIGDFVVNFLIEKIDIRKLNCKSSIIENDKKKIKATTINKLIERLRFGDEYYFTRKENNNRYLIYSKLSRNYYHGDKVAATVLKSLKPGTTNEDACTKIAETLGIHHDEALQLTNEITDSLNAKNIINMPFDNLSAPLRVSWRITDYCNINCRHCLNYKNNRYEPTIKEIDNAINHILESKIFEIGITGGEPLLSKNLFHILDGLQSLSINLLTNGILLPKNIDKLSKYNIRIVVSLDGFKDEHEFIRGKETYEKTLNSIYLLEQAEIPFTINTVAHKNNLNTMERFIDHHIDKDRSVILNILSPLGMAQKNKDMFLNENETIKLKTIIEKYFQQVHPIYEFLELPPDKRNKMTCSGGRIKLDILPDGTATTCSLSEGFVLGNIYKESIKSIWQNERRKKFLDFIASWSGFGPCSAIKNLYEKEHVPLYI
jgi:MoaA/NifB/PqqE/SkfB family radical SAM enzyme